MSTLVVEVCRIAAVEPHPRADRLAIATVKGWKVCIGYDPETKSAQFAVGEKCVYFPPDSVLPPALAEDRLNVMRHLGALPKDENGERPGGGRVKAARLRGEQSFGVLMTLSSDEGDDLEWPVGTDVQDHFGVKKWEPPTPVNDGDKAPRHADFHRYTDMEHWSNYPHILHDQEEVVVTEKLHGKNSRVGLVHDEHAQDDPGWTWMAGSHDVRRCAGSVRTKNFRLDRLVEKLVLESPVVATGDILDLKNGELWRVETVDPQSEEGRISAVQIDQQGRPILIRSEFWEPLNDSVKALLTYLRDEFPWPEPKRGIVLFGEIIGRGVQKRMEYGQAGRSYRAFDIAINGRYLDFADKQSLLEKFDVEMTPVLYRGPFDAEQLRELTDGPTTLAGPQPLGKFRGREGVVVTPVVERCDEEMLCAGSRGRVIFKSVSADYLAAKGISDAH